MKKIISVLLAAAMLLALCASLASCANKCTDDTHEWDEGKITATATQEKDGEKTFTCKICAETKTESIAFTGYTKEEWDAAFADSLFENFACKVVAVTKAGGISGETEMHYKVTKNSAWAKVIFGNESEEETSNDTAEIEELRSFLIGSVKELAIYDKFEYDAETKSYKAKSPIEISDIGESTSDITLKFAEGKLVECYYSISFTAEDMDCTATNTITFSDYGTVVLN